MSSDRDGRASRPREQPPAKHAGSGRAVSVGTFLRKVFPPVHGFEVVAEPGPSDVDYEQLSAYLRALALPNRLALLRKLQVPRTSREIALAPVRHDAGLNPERPLTRQTIEEHIGKLQEIGLVHARASTRDGRAATEYELNHARLFVIVDELRRLCLIQPTGSGTAVTVDADDKRARPAMPAGPALLLVNGPREGQVFALGGSGPWTIGRQPGLPVCLPFDPFVSRENARLAREAHGFVLEALPESRNGTRVNMADLAEGATSALVPGDVLGVGRSLLVFRG